ncbi:MAG: hypothetical protein U0800_19260 [Isosphaeraceae bacterium]
MQHEPRLKVFWSGKERDQVLSSLEDLLRRDGSINLLEDISDAFFSESVEIEGLEVQWVKGLFLALSARFPEEEFAVRWVGQEIDDVWILWFRAGRALRAVSLNREREGPLRSEPSKVNWPEPLDLERVVSQVGLKTFLREFLFEQPPKGTISAVTLRAQGDERPKALIYVGPLGQDVRWRITSLFRPKYDVQFYGDPEKLLKDPTATAKDPCSY